MDDQAGTEPPVKRKRKPPSRKGMGPTPTSWKPGCPSPNPGGRPRKGLAFAERVRERVDPDTVIDLALRVAGDESLPTIERLAALLPLVDRGFLRPPQSLAMQVTSVDAAEDLSGCTDEQLAELEKLEAMRAAVLERSRDRAQLPEPAPAIDPGADPQT